MPQYHDAVLDHAGGGPKTVYWPDQPPRPARRPGRRPQARSLLAALRRRRASYTVTPEGAAPPRPAAPLCRSFSYIHDSPADPARPPSPAWSTRSAWTPTPPASRVPSATPSPASTPPSTPRLPRDPPRPPRGSSPAPRGQAWSAPPSPGQTARRALPPTPRRYTQAWGEGVDPWAGCISPTDWPDGRARSATITMAQNTAQYRQWLQGGCRPPPPSTCTPSRWDTGTAFWDHATRGTLTRCLGDHG